MQLIRHGTEVLLTRGFASGDCRAVAQATAVVAEAYFVEVHGWLREPEGDQSREAGPPTVEPAPAPSAAQPVESSSPIDGARSGTVRPGRTVDAQPSLLNRGPSHAGWTQRRQPVSVPNRGISRPRRASTALGVAFLGVGPTFALPRTGLSLRLEGGGGIELPTTPFSVELQVATSSASVSGGEPDRVRRWASEGLLRLGAPMGTSIRYRPWAGLGATLVEVRALDVPGASTRSRVVAVMGGGLELAWPVLGRWFGRLDSSCMVLSSRDSYRVEPDGEIGRGPRVVCSSTVGIRFGSARPGE
jgi:hypothetical protein